jgi:hypothetical protein
LEGLCQKKEREKANQLRKKSYEEALYTQGVIDGIIRLPNYLEEFIKEIENPIGHGETS